MVVFMAKVSVAEAAKRLGVGVPRIHQRIVDGSLRAERIGSQWAIDELSLLRVSERTGAGSAVVGPIGVGDRRACRG